MTVAILPSLELPKSLLDRRTAQVGGVEHDVEPPIAAARDAIGHERYSLTVPAFGDDVHGDQLPRLPQPMLVSRLLDVPFKLSMQCAAAIFSRPLDHRSRVNDPVPRR